MVYVQEGRIIEICGHQWIEVDPNLTQPCSEVFTIEEVIQAQGNKPYRNVATNLQGDC